LERDLFERKGRGRRGRADLLVGETLDLEGKFHLAISEHPTELVVEGLPELGILIPFNQT
jgi:hypothetical protein